LRNGLTLAMRPGLLRVATVSLALVVAGLNATPAPASTSCPSPPAVFPEASITPGMIGTGLTVVRGTQPTSFTIKVIGTLPDAILPGFDLVIFQITGPQDFLEKAHGVAAGMSGSPIYINHKLAGAVSYSFGLAADPMIGLFTPAQKMVNLLNYPSAAAAAMPRSVTVTRQARIAVARAAGVSVSAVPGSVQRLTIPLAVKGLSAREADRLQSVIDAHGLPLAVMRTGASTSSTTTDPTVLKAGESMSAVLSTGDVTLAGVGTATFSCGDVSVGWGHDFFFGGQTAFGMAGASIVTIIDDKSQLFGPFKIPVVTALHGTILQDRLAGILGQAGDAPPAMPVDTTFTDTDTSTSRTGQTDILYQKDFWGPEITYEHLIENLILVFDHFGPGTLRLSYEIQGLRADGVTPFTVQNSNMEYSSYDAFQAAYKLLGALYQLAFNPFERITFTGVSATGDITTHQLVGDIARVRTASTLQPALRVRPTLRARPGTAITIEVTLQPVEGGAPVVSTFSLRVPRGASGFARVVVRRGSSRVSFEPPKEGGSFDDLLATLNNGEHPNDLVVSGFGRTLLQQQDLVVQGRSVVAVDVV
jgi:SpoIVB peptidase S55